MPYKSLFTEDERWTNDARDIEAHVYSLFGTVFKKYLASGYGPREIAYVLNSTVTNVELDVIIDVQAEHDKTHLKQQLLGLGVLESTLSGLGVHEMNALKNKLHHEIFQAKVDEINQKKETQQPLCL